MRLLIQRVREAEVRVEDRSVGKIGIGLLVFLGVHLKDTANEGSWLIRKLINLRIFSDSEGKMNLSILDVEEAGILVVSQFTLYADCAQGRRPAFTSAAPPPLAKKLYELFVYDLKQSLKETKCKVETGEFGAYMQVGLINDGPATFILENS